MNAKQGQSFLDLVIQGTGSLDNVLAMAVLNGVSITDELTIGQEVKANTTKAPTYFHEKNLPATAVSREETAVLEGLDGIDYMEIGFDFIVR